MGKELGRNEEIGHQLSKVSEELKSSLLILREKDTLIQNLTWQVDETKITLRSREQDLKNEIRNIVSSDRERQALDWKEKGSLQKEMEELEQKCVLIEQRRVAEVAVC